MRNAGLKEAQAGIKTARRNINNLRYADDQPRQYIKKQRHYFSNRGVSSQGYGFSSSHVWMRELDSKES